MKVMLLAKVTVMFRILVTVIQVVSFMDDVLSALKVMHDFLSGFFS